MLQTRFLALTAAAALAAATSAQNCPFNLHPIHIVDAAGIELPNTPSSYGDPIALVPTEAIYLAFDPTTPTGTYYVHATGTGAVEPIVVSNNDPMDRFVHVQNDNGTISLSLPFSSNPAGAVFGTGLGGFGQSLLVGPLHETEFSECTFKVQFGDHWDLAYGPEWPYLLRGGINPANGQCSIYSYHSIRIGNGSGTNVNGLVFDDDNRNGLRDVNELGLANQEVRLLADGVQLSATTDVSGAYVFENVVRGDWTVELVLPSGFVATTASSQALSVCECADVEAHDIGIDEEILPCNAKPLCYWRSSHGACAATAAGILPTLPALGLVNTWGQYVCPGSKNQLKSYLRWANCWNMAYSLSAQLTAMHANVITGKVDVNCVICDPCLGVMTIETLMQQAIVAIQSDRYTPPCGGGLRGEQRALRNALWRANKNRIWQ